eukprot:TRINITY_DN11358_c0_g1_i1.p1 TRINITY_DN11358_c0_g1~~TRINITY_DN11358_c0_g1_i1.p1  ORF type:complete len:388 (+),score=127.56 TRINITY_DN11358_c0_g1_i1:117-1280(+)
MSSKEEEIEIESEGTGPDPLIPDMHRLIIKLYITGYYDRSFMLGPVTLDEDDEDNAQMDLERNAITDKHVRAYADRVLSRHDASKEWMRWCDSRRVCKTWKRLADEIIASVGVTVEIPPLIAAARGGHFESCKFFLGFEMFDPSRDNYEVFFSAIQSANYDIVKLLLQDERIDPASRNSWALVQTILKGSTEIVLLLLEDGRVDPAAQNDSAIVYSSLEGKEDIVTLLLSDPRVNPAQQDNEALMLACQGGHASTVSLLLQHALVDPTARNNQALRLAVKGGHLVVVEMLVKDGRADPSVNMNELLHYIKSLSFGDFPKIKQLLITDARVKEALTKEMQEKERKRAAMQAPKKELIASDSSENPIQPSEIPTTNSETVASVQVPALP